MPTTQDFILDEYAKTKARIQVAIATNQIDKLWELDHYMDKLLILDIHEEMKRMSGDAYNVRDKSHH